MAASNSTAASYCADMKVCGKCKKCLPASTEYFARKASAKGGLNSQCKKCGAEYTKAWKASNPEHQKQWIEANRDAVKIQRAQYRQDNKKKISDYMHQWLAENKNYHAEWSARNRDKRRDSCNRYHERMNRDSQTFRISRSMSSLVKHVLKKSGIGKGGKSWVDLVDYSPQELKVHLERQFKKGMTWENYGDWHVDHIRPVISFDIKEAGDDEFRACWSLCNLRPLWAKENIAKGGRIVTLL